MGTFSQGIALHSSGSGPTLPHSSSTSSTHRSSLKAPNQVRWPVNLNQLAALSSLDDDSDLDRSFTDVSRDDIGSVKLLRMLKDSDDESNSVVLPQTQTRLRRPRSTYSSLQVAQQKQQQQQHSQQGGIPRPPQRTKSENKGSSSASSHGGMAANRHMGLRHHQSDVSLINTSRRQASTGSTGTSDNPEDMERIFSEANAVAQRLGGSSGQATDHSNLATRGPVIKSGSSSTSSASITLRKPSSIPSSPYSSLHAPSIGGAHMQSNSRLSVPSKASSSVSSSPSGLKQRMSVPGTKDLRQAAAAGRRDRETPSPPRLPGSPGGPGGSLQPTSTPTGARKLAGLQQSPLSRPMVLKHAATESQIATAMLPTPPTSTLSSEMNIADVENKRAIRELTEELERWKTEASEYRQQRVAAEAWRKQISNLERDLETALESLQSSEASVIEAKSQQDTTGSKLAEHERTIEELTAKLCVEKTLKDKALEEATTEQNQQLEVLKIRNEELEKKLTQAQHEIDQLELQVVPAELQDVHQSLFSATQELEEVKKHNEKLSMELAEEKIRVTREQEDSGQLLVKLSQLQDTIANHIRDNNALKEVIKDHDKCQENAEIVDHQHKKEVEGLQNEIQTHQQGQAQEKDQRSRFEQALQEHQYQVHQLHQQVQLQQTQLLQQQTEIVNLRAKLEVEQQQAALLQQRLQDEQRLNNPHFGRRVSMDGELNGSFLMIETSNGGVNPGALSSSMSGAADSTGMGAMGMMMPAGPGGQSLSTSGPGPLSPMTASMIASSGLQPVRNFDGSPSANSLLTNQFNMSAAQVQAQAAALPPTATTPVMPMGGGMVAASAGPGSALTMEIEPKPRMAHRGSSGSISGILATSSNRLSMYGDSLGSSTAVTQTVEELTAQLQSLLKEKERLQADLSKIPTSGGGPMTRRKADMLEEQMDETERTISKIRYSIRMRS